MTSESASLLSYRDHFQDEAPFFTIAIPQYGRRKYLEINLKSICSQDFPDFEIVVSDDCSQDDSNAVIPELMAASGRTFRYFAQKENLGYDRNVRFCLRAARGRYVFMLGNDDALASDEVLTSGKEVIESLRMPEVCITNFQDWGSGKITRRVYGSGILGTGPAAAVHYFRSLSFTTGLIFDREAAIRHETDRWDHSIFYQIYLGCRIIAAGGRLAGVDVVTFRDHIRIDGKLTPEHFRVKYRGAPWSLKHKHTGLDSVARVTVDAVLPFVAPAARSAIVRRVYTQILAIAYPFWLFEYKQLANWGMAFGVARDLWPPNRLAEYRLRVWDLLYLWCLYIGSTVCGLTIPAFLFNSVRHRLAAWVRRRRQRLIK